MYSLNTEHAHADRTLKAAAGEAVTPTVVTVRNAERPGGRLRGEVELRPEKGTERERERERESERGGEGGGGGGAETE